MVYKCDGELMPTKSLKKKHGAGKGEPDEPAVPTSVVAAEPKAVLGAAAIVSPPTTVGPLLPAPTDAGIKLPVKAEAAVVKKNTIVAVRLRLKGASSATVPLPLSRKPAAGCLVPAAVRSRTRSSLSQLLRTDVFRRTPPPRRKMKKGDPPYYSGHVTPAGKVKQDVLPPGYFRTVKGFSGRHHWNYHGPDGCIISESASKAWLHFRENGSLEAAHLASATLVDVAPAVANAAAAETVGVTVAVAAADTSCDTSQQVGQDSFSDWEGYGSAEEDGELAGEFASLYASPASATCSPRSPFTDAYSGMTSKSPSPAFGKLEGLDDFNLPPALFDAFSLRSRTASPFAVHADYPPASPLADGLGELNSPWLDGGGHASGALWREDVVPKDIPSPLAAKAAPPLHGGDAGAAHDEAPPSAPAPVQSGVGERESQRQRKAPSRWSADPLSVLNLGGRLSELEQARGGGDAGGGDDAGGGGLRLPAPRARKKIIGRVIACGTPGCSRGAYHDGLCSTERAGKRTRSTTNYNGRKRS